MDNGRSGGGDEGESGKGDIAIGDGEPCKDEANEQPVLGSCALYCAII